MSTGDPTPMLIVDHEGVEKPPQLVGLVGRVRQDKMTATAECQKPLWSVRA